MGYASDPPVPLRAKSEQLRKGSSTNDRTGCTNECPGFELEIRNSGWGGRCWGHSWTSFVRLFRRLFRYCRPVDSECMFHDIRSVRDVCVSIDCVGYNNIILLRPGPVPEPAPNAAPIHNIRCVHNTHTHTYLCLAY